VSIDSGVQGARRIEDHGVRLSIRHELIRKGLHLLSATIPLAYAAGLSRAIIIWGLTIALVVAAAIELTRVRSARARSAFHIGVGPLLREREHTDVSGATWLIVALLIAAVGFPRDVAIAAMCAVSLGDAAAAIVGRSLARRDSTPRKSLAGSIACFTASAIAARAIADFTVPDAFIAGVLASVAERLGRPIDDNLRITIAVGCGILLWRMGFS
jgi:dolichol kinase